MRCIKCGQPLGVFKIYNAGKDKEYPGSVLSCNNGECDRHGLLTVIYGEVKKSKRKGVQSGDVQVSS